MCEKERKREYKMDCHFIIFGKNNEYFFFDIPAILTSGLEKQVVDINKYLFEGSGGGDTFVSFSHETLINSY